MAQVKLDISEYELMKENAKLLKESLEREKELSDKLDVSNKEKIDALKSNEKMVTIVKRQSVSTMVKTRMPVSDIRRHLSVKINQIIRKVLSEAKGGNSHDRRGDSFFNSDRDLMFGSSNHRGHEPMRHITRDLDNLIDYVSREYDFKPENLHDLFYKEDQVITSDSPEEITMQGLDQVSADMKTEALDELKKNAREALSLNPILEKEARDARIELEKTQKSLKATKGVSTKKSQEIVQLLDDNARIQALIKDNAVKLTHINLVVSPEITTFGNKKKLIEVKQILSVKDER
tara:strand:+ start:45359 stop:46231 length:873 start_codon:yes stop_codon:yes gene_type:complete